MIKKCLRKSKKIKKKSKKKSKKNQNSKFKIQNSKLKSEKISKSKIQNPKSKTQNLKPENLVQRLCPEKSENISSRDYVQKNLKSSLDVIDKSPPHSCYISMLVKTLNINKPPQSVSICMLGIHMPLKRGQLKCPKTPIFDFPSKAGSVTFLD